MLTLNGLAYYFDLYQVLIMLILNGLAYYFVVSQVPSGSVPAGAACPHGLDVDGHDAGPHLLARDGGHLRQHLPAQVLAPRRRSKTL